MWIPAFPGHSDYIRNAPNHPSSPWRVVTGWCLETVFHDPMHVLFLGTCKDLYASMLGYWARNGYLGSGTLNEVVRDFSQDLKEKSGQQGRLGLHLNKPSSKEKGMNIRWGSFVTVDYPGNQVHYWVYPYLEWIIMVNWWGVPNSFFGLFTGNKKVG